MSFLDLSPNINKERISSINKSLSLPLMAFSSPSQSLLLLLLLIFSLLSASTFSSSSEVDILMSFKSSMEDPTFSLSNWTPNSSNPCNWTGITCATTTSSLITSLDLHNLNLSGEISPSICKLSQLSSLNLANNYFNQPIPLHLSHCTNLLNLNLSNNLLWGTLPDQISMLANLNTLDLSKNRIEGQIPLSLGSLQHLKVLNLASNLFTGTLNSNLFANLSGLLLLDLSQNPSLASELPPEIGKLANLRWLMMQSSGLYGGIPESLAGLHELEILDLSQNNLTGTISSGFGSKLVSLDLSQNNISGSFPFDPCYGKTLIELSLHDNFFTGLVPDTIVNCSTLEKFQVQNNRFSGELPTALWLLPKLKVIRAENNRLSGEIPTSIGASPHLEQVQIDNNSFTGTIPQGLGVIQSMYRFSASLNGFSGDIPENFCGSPSMSIINLSHNSLSGSIPQTWNCKKLVSLSLADNNLTGSIPASLGHLPVLTYIDLSSNQLSNPIPPELQNLKLALFNISYNQLSGKVPFSLVSGLPASGLLGNPELCVPTSPNGCDAQSRRRASKPNGLIWVAIAISFVVGLMVLSAGLYLVYKLSRRKFNSGTWKSVFFYPLRITEDELMMALAGKTVIGSGGFGKVHLVHLSGGEFVTVKKLLNSGQLSFSKVKAEMEILAKARHKNIAKLLGFYYKEDSILLIQEYFQKGSLGDILHKSEFALDWKIRLKIATGSAQGLVYLHKVYIPHILHGNMKSNNILLDQDFEPKLSGFGINRVIGETSYNLSMTTKLDSACYIPPELGYAKKATEKVDVYSFGVNLLELITGRPTEHQEAGESVDVVKWVRRKINMSDGALQILDPKISNSAQQEMLAVLDLALRCTSVMPEKRPNMVEVLEYLESSSIEFHDEV